MTTTVRIGTGQNEKTLPVHAGKVVLEINDPELNPFPMGIVQATLGAAEDAPLVVILTLAPDLEFAPHYHDTDQCFVVLEGSMRVGRTWHRPGSVRFQEGGTVYGPLLVGPEGVKTICFYADASRTFPDKFASERDQKRAEDLKVKLYSLFPKEEVGITP